MHFTHFSCEFTGTAGPVDVVSEVYASFTREKVRNYARLTAVILPETL